MGRLLVTVHGHRHELPEGMLTAELGRSGPPPKLPLLEAVIRHAPRAQAIERLTEMLGHPVPPGGEPVAMHAALGLLWLMPTEPPALQALRRFAGRARGAAGATVAAGVWLIEAGPAALAAGPGGDPLLLRWSTRSVAALGQPGALVPEMPQLVEAWMAALDLATKTAGAHAFRAFLGDIAEALYRVVLRASPSCHVGQLMTERQAATLLDTITTELPGTSDFLAARAMVWLLGLLGPPDDAGIAAIERARDRFANEEFHKDCEIILSGGRWPPPRTSGSRSA